MKDFLPKGTGNSRYLKSAIPTGTTWEQVLTMLIEGNFPVDFNGINASGIVDRGTPLNKANLLKDATAQHLGLTTANDPTVDDAFNALKNSANQIASDVSDLSSLLYKTPSGDLELKGNNVNFVVNGKVTKNGVEIGGANAGFRLSYAITLPRASDYTLVRTFEVPPGSYIKISTDTVRYEGNSSTGTFVEGVEVSCLSADTPEVEEFIFEALGWNDPVGSVSYSLSGTNLTVTVTTDTHTGDYSYRFEYTSLVEVFSYQKEEITVN